ncbi:MAG: hypothetical protein ACK44M_09420, partial [Chloroflexus sp.]
CSARSRFTCAPMDWLRRRVDRSPHSWSGLPLSSPDPLVTGALAVGLRQPVLLALVVVALAVLEECV